MNILFVLENYYPNIGGVETLFKSLCEALAKKGHKVTVYTNKFDAQLKSRENINGVNIIRAPLKNRYLFTLFGWWGAYKYAKHVDLINTTSYNAAVPALIAGILRKKKVIITFHEVWGKLWFSLPFMNKLVLSLHYLFEQMLLRLPFYRFIGVSNTTTSRLKESGIKQEKVITIVNGIDYSQITHTWSGTNDARPFVFTFFGRLGISKGLDILIPAFAKLHQETPDVKLNLVIPKTPPSLYNQVKGDINELNIKNAISIRSNLSFDELQELISRSNAVVIPSYSEGFCFAAIETMAIGTPIIASDKGALKEVVSGKHIFINKLNAISTKQALSEALENRWIQTPMIKFPLQDTIEAYLELYNSVVKQ